MRRRLFAAVAVAAVVFCPEANGADALWRSIRVHFKVDEKGAFHISERAEITLPPDATTLERHYWSDAYEPVIFDGIWRVQPDGTELALTPGTLDEADHFTVVPTGTIQWSVRNKGVTDTGPVLVTYIIDSHVTGVVNPAWTIRRARRTWSTTAGIPDLRARLQTLIESAKYARLPKRYLLDHSLLVPPSDSNGFKYDVWLDFARPWHELEPVTGENLGHFEKGDDNTPDVFRVTHLLDWQGAGSPALSPVEPHVERLEAFAALPAAGLAVWLLAVLYAAWRRGSSGGEVDEEWIRTHVYADPPEIVRARWSGITDPPSIAAFLRRMEKARKLSIRIDQSELSAEDRDPDDPEPQYKPKVYLRLLVPREQLTEYERDVIHSLMENGQEITSEQIQKKYEAGGFDPADALRAAVRKVAVQSKSKSSSPWYWKLLAFAVFMSGVFFMARGMEKMNVSPVVLFGTIISCVAVMSLWPDMLSRWAINKSIATSFVVLIPLLIVTAIALALHLASDVPLEPMVALGVTLALLAVYGSIVAASLGQSSVELAKARSYFASLLDERRTLQGDSAAYAAALGLPVTMPKAPDEDWAEELVVL